MAVTYSNQEIKALIQERKSLPESWRNQFVTRAKRRHKESQLDLIGDAGNKFRIIIRQSQFNSSDFSVILGVYVPQLGQLFRLRRYNGNSHEHTNHLEKTTFVGFHIHFATARYQQEGM